MKMDALMSGFNALPAHERQRACAEVRVLVLEGLGLNCEVETTAAFRAVGADPQRVHLLDLLDGHARLEDFSILAFGGGFAFGDHLGGGFVLANKIRWRLYDQLIRFIESGGLAIGICNGFQTMVRLGLLPGLDGDYRTPRAALVPNEKLGYRNAWVRVQFTDESPCWWTRGIGSIELPSRHGEGRFITESTELFDQLDAAGQLCARYVDGNNAITEAWPANPNGSERGVAGLCDPSGRLFGLMPHPEAYFFPWQHPDWSLWKAKGEAPEEGAGLAIFKNGVEAAAATLAQRV